MNIIVLVFAVLAVAAYPMKMNAASLLDLSGWGQETYPTGLSVDSPPDWVLGAENTSVTQTTNAYPSFLYRDQKSTMGLTNLSVQISVECCNDDDLIGFALGFEPGDSGNSSADYLLIDWKRTSQNFEGSFSPAGLAVSRVTGVPERPFPEFWEHSGAVNELQRASTLSNEGWEFDTLYNFDLEFTSSIFRLFVNDTQEIYLEGEFSDGRLAFYNGSQPNVVYSAEVPLPGAILFLGSGLAVLGALAWGRRRTVHH